MPSKSDVDNIIIANGGKPNNSGLTYCSVHDDRTPSLKVSVSSTGKLLVHCHAGCSKDAVIADFKARGLWPGREVSIKAHHRSPSRHEEEAEQFRRAYGILRAVTKANIDEGPLPKPLPYLKGRGIGIIPNGAKVAPASLMRERTGIPFPAMVLHIVNAAGKLQGAQLTFLNRNGTRNLRSRRTGKNIRLIYGPKKGGYVQLVEPHPDKPLIIAEGVEKGLAAARIANLPAITTIGKDPDVVIPPCSEVIIAADNDKDGGGLKYAKLLAENLTAPGRVIRIAIPPDGYKDWDDVLKDAGESNLEELRRLILRAKKFKRAQEIRLLTAEEFMAVKFPERPYLLKPWLRTSSLAMIHAQRGHGKTWLALSIAHAIASGSDLLGWSAEKPARVLYVDGELPGEAFQDRLAKFGPLPSNLFIRTREELFLKGIVMPDLAEQAGQQFFDKIVEQNAIDVIILDSVSTLFRSGVENEAESWAPIQDWILKHRWRGRTIILLHHEGRNNKPRGTSKREDVLETIIALKAAKEDSETDDKDSAFELTFSKAREFYGNDAAPMILHLSTKFGRIEWTREGKAESTRDRVADLAKQKWKQVDIAKELGLTEGRVSQIAKELKMKAEN